MSDQDTSVRQLREIVKHFVDEREWNQFHSPKNLSMALAIEAAELMEHFQWLTVEQSHLLKNDPEKMTAVGEELADVIGYSLAMANELDIDITSIVRDKMKKNERKYPTEKYRGRSSLEENENK